MIEPHKDGSHHNPSTFMVIFYFDVVTEVKGTELYELISRFPMQHRWTCSRISLLLGHGYFYFILSIIILFELNHQSLPRCVPLMTLSMLGPCEFPTSS